MDIESRPMDESYSYMLDFLKNLKDNNKGIGNIYVARTVDKNGNTTDVKFGNMVTIDHGNGYISIYRNMGDPLVTEGSAIDKGDIIFVISEDNTTLGYQIQQNEQYINPEELTEING